MSPSIDSANSIFGSSPILQWKTFVKFSCVFLLLESARGEFQSEGVQELCLDQYARRLGVTKLPDSASKQYKKLYCQYTKVDTAKGPIEIYGQNKLSSLQLYRARKILMFFIEDYDCKSVQPCYGNKSDLGLGEKMAQNKAKLDMPNGVHEQPGAGKSLQGQELYEAETRVEGDKWFMKTTEGNEKDFRDAALEEILHLVHDTGIGIDGSNSQPGVMSEFQELIRAATNTNLPTWLGGNGNWGQNDKKWINELKKENSLTQEYLASVIDVYYGLWGHSNKGMWDIYLPNSRAKIQPQDPQAWALLPTFFNPWITYMAMLHPNFTGTFKLVYDSSLEYTHKTQYYLHATLLGNKNANFVGNSQNNCFGPNAGINTINGGAGTDVVLFQGKCAEYTFGPCQLRSCTVIDSVDGRDGTTKTVSIERLSFADADYDSSTGSCTKLRSTASKKCRVVIRDQPPFQHPTPTTAAPTSAGCCKTCKWVKANPGKRCKKRWAKRKCSICKLNGEQVCEKKGYKRKKCNKIGCCGFDGKQCWSSVGKQKCYK